MIHLIRSDIGISQKVRLSTVFQLSCNVRLQNVLVTKNSLQNSRELAAVLLNKIFSRVEDALDTHRRHLCINMTNQTLLFLNRL